MMNKLERCLWNCVLKRKFLIFHIYFLNMDISLIIALICLKTCMRIAELCLKGTMSQNFDEGLSFCFMVHVYRKRDLKKNTQKNAIVIR